MSLITSSIKGTLDLLPKDSYKTQYIEAAMREIAENYGFYERSKRRAFLCGLCANVCSAALGFFLAEPVWQFVVSIS